MIDIQLLRIFKNRKDMYSLYRAIPRETLDKTTVAIIDDIRTYFEKFPTREAIDASEFIPRFYTWHPGLTEEQKNSYNAVFRMMLAKDADADARRNIIGDIAEIELSTTLANIAERHSAGEVENIFAEVNKANDTYRERTGYKNAAYIQTPIEELMKQEFDNSGLKWRLHCLNRSMRGLRPGDFGIIAGRPDKGKTSFVASEVTHFAGQLPENQNVIWLNNEGPGDRIIPRLYQAALGYSMEDMKRAINAGTLVDDYRKVLGGRLDRIRIFDIHGFDNGQVEAILQDNEPGVVVYDMIDNIQGFGNESRTDRALEEMYKWARERSVKYGFVGIGTSQISNEGDGLQFPTLGMLKDSKTGKQGACDFQLMIGASNDPNLNMSRFLGLPKNKLRRPGYPGDPRADVLFDADKCRYVDREIVLTHAEAEELIDA